jgi:dTDP-4-dehydrorhamnose 3,5-epimerase
MKVAQDKSADTLTIGPRSRRDAVDENGETSSQVNSVTLGKTHMEIEKIFNLKVLGDDRGSLIALEEGGVVPFNIKRVYYIFGTQDKVSRGFHAHKELQQLAVCVSGKCRLLLDDGINKTNVWLDSPSKAILINKMIWHEMHDFSSDCVMIVLADNIYEESDYIRNYGDFQIRVALND